MKTTNKSMVDYVDHMGSDLSVVNSARVSFNKTQLEMDEGDERLIKYLARHNHWSPFAHTSIQLRVHAPLFVARQMVKHQVGGVWNEVSRRYVDDEPEFYFPDYWRKRANNKKQGSCDHEYIQSVSTDTAQDLVYNIVDCYNRMIEDEVAPELARMILPQNMMTTWYWTGSLMFFHRVYKQRTDPHAQKESQDVANQIGAICSKLFPISWKELNNV